jgi:hypothetical protein
MKKESAPEFRDEVLRLRQGLVGGSSRSGS